MVLLAHYAGLKAEIYMNGAPCSEYFGMRDDTDRANATKFTKEYVRYIESQADTYFGVRVTFDNEFPCAKHECAHGTRLVLICDNIRLASTTIRNETVRDNTSNRPWQKTMESIIRRKNRQIVTQRFKFEGIRLDRSDQVGDGRGNISSALFVEDTPLVSNQQDREQTSDPVDPAQDDMPHEEEMVQEETRLETGEDSGMGTIRLLFFNLEWVSKPPKRETFKLPGRMKCRKAEDTTEAPLSNNESAIATAHGLAHLVGFAAPVFTTKQAPQKAAKQKGKASNKKRREPGEWKHVDPSRRPFAEVVFHYRPRDKLASSGILDM